MLPLSDGLHPRRFPIVNAALIAANFAVLLVGSFVGLIEIVPVIGPLFGSILVLAVGVRQSLHEHVLPTHGSPTDRAALERALS
jgi:hypothetical protein